MEHLTKNLLNSVKYWNILTDYMSLESKLNDLAIGILLDTSASSCINILFFHSILISMAKYAMQLHIYALKDNKLHIYALKGDNK